MRYLKPALVVLLLILLGAPVWAQSTFGEIRGTIVDASGSVIPGASVVAKNIATGESRTVTTDNFGNYAALNLDAGPYEVSIEHTGFRKQVVQNVTLRAREIVRADARLEVSGTTTEVMVTESRQVIQTDTAAVIDSKNAEQIQKLPVNFRAGSTNSVFASLSYTPGVQTDAGGGGLSLAGGMPFQMTSSVDGISSINVRSNGIVGEMFPSTDAIDEIKISSVSNNAEYAQIGDVTTTSRAGTNTLHGSAFWYTQNGVMDARDFFSSRQGAPFKVSNDFGAHGGGPVKKNKTFFFAAWEALRFRAQSVLNSTVPPDSYRTGNLSSVSAVIRDPLGGTFAGNVIPASRISPVSAKAIELLYPRQSVAGNTVSSSNLLLLRSARNDNNQFDVRGDHVFSSKHNVFGRYSWKNANVLSPFANPIQGEARNITRVRTLAVAHNYVISPTVVNELRGGFATRPFQTTFGPDGQDFDGPAIVKQLGIQGLRADPPKVASSPDIGITGFLGTARTRGYTQLSKNIQFNDNLTWTKGRHTMKFGGDFRRIRTTDNVSFFSGDDLGEYRFNGTFSGNAFTDFLLGYPNSTRYANTGPDIDGNTVHQAYFAQDDFKVNSKLTLNYGIRYELRIPFWDSTLQLANFDRDFPGGRVIVPNEDSLKLTAPAFRAGIGNTPIITAAAAGIPERLRYTDRNNFMPRFGFAYRPWGNRTVIRGGYGVYSVTILGAVFYSLVGIHTSDTRTFTNSLNAQGVPNLAFPSPFGAGIGNVSAVGSADFRRGNDVRSADPYVQQWSFTIERDLGWNTGLRVTYQGSHSLKMFASPDLNQVRPNTVGYPTARAGRPYPNWAIVYSRDPIVAAKYNAVLTEFNRRFTRGFGFQTSWAWSKNLSNATGSNSTGFAGEAGSVPTDRLNLGLDYGNVSSTRRHRVLTIFNYETPFGKGRKFMSNAHPAADMILGGWELSGILLFQTGPFLTPITSGNTDPSGTNLNSRANNRPDYAASVSGYGNLPEGERTISRWFAADRFVNPAANIGRFGMAGPGQLIGPGTQTVSAKLQKQVNITERVNLKIEGSFTNLLNTANFGIPGLTVNAASFGNITSTQGAEAGGGRAAQVGMRLSF